MPNWENYEEMDMEGEQKYRSHRKTTKLGKKKKRYNGLDFYEITYPITIDVNTTFALSPTEKAVMTGKLSFDRHVNSFMYEPEVVITVWSTSKPHIEARAENEGYYRLEIPVPVPVFERILHLALDRLWNFRRKGEL